MSQGKNLPYFDHLTAQEHLYLGSTPPITPRNESDWFTPQGLLVREDFRPSVEDVIAARSTGWQNIGGPLENGYKLYGFGSDDDNFAVKLQPLNLDTGQTMKDPQFFIGRWDEDKKILTDITEDITERVQLVAHKGHEYLHPVWREGKPTGPEGTYRGGLER